MMRAFSISKSVYHVLCVVFYAFCICYFATLFAIPLLLTASPIIAYIEYGNPAHLFFIIGTIPMGFMTANVLWNPDFVLMPFKLFDRFYYHKKIKGWEL